MPEESDVSQTHIRGGTLLCITFLLKSHSDFFTPYYEMSYRLLLMPLACVGLDLLKSKKLESFLSWFGKYSLEIYVLQMVMIGMMDNILQQVGFRSDYYSVWQTILAFGVVFAVCAPVHKMIDRIIKKNNNN